MNASIESKGRDVDDAIERGLAQLHVNREAVAIEIIDHGKKGVWGYGTKPALVRLTKLPSFQEQAATVEHALDIDFHENLPPSGVVWVVDGKIHCKDAEEGMPTITPSPEIVLYKNGERVWDKTEVKEQDKWLVEIAEENRETQWNISYDDFKVKAILDIQPGLKMIRTLEDQVFSRNLYLTIKEEMITENHLKIEDIYQKLKDMGIRTGWDQEEMQKACEAMHPGQYLIASGSMPKAGQHGRLELLVDTERKKGGPKELDDGSIDFRELQYFPSVEQGQLIAVLHPPIPGSPGLTVTGEMIPPAPVLPLSIRAGQGVRFDEEQGKILAEASGRPEIALMGMTAKVSVLPKLEIQQDVDLSTGNISFTGDVEISGNVIEDMKVNAEGHLLIKGTVSQANLTAGQSIEIRGNVFVSTLFAGNSSLLLTELNKQLGDLLPHLNEMITAVQQLMDSNRNTNPKAVQAGLVEVIRILLDRKFSFIIPLIQGFSEKVKEEKSKLDGEWLELAFRLKRDVLFCHTGQLKKMVDLTQLVAEAERLHKECNLAVVAHDYIKVPYALKSKLYCNGAVEVTGLGCHQTFIHAGDRVLIKGTLRGGEVFAGKGVEVAEAGSKGGITTLIAVPEDQSIKIDKAWADTVVRVGNRKHVFYDSVSRVYARLDKEGNLLLF